MHYTKDTNIIEVVVDIATLRSKIEKLQDNIDAVEKESEYLKKLNNDMNIKKEKIRESLDIGIRELEEAKEKVKNLEQEKDELNEALFELKQYSDKLERNNDSLMKASSLNKNTIDREVCFIILINFVIFIILIELVNIIC